MSQSLPFVGAAMTADYLPQYKDWLISGQRDLEIQDFIDVSLLDSGEWKDRVADIKSKLDGYSGRMGIHAPFWNLSAATLDPKVREVVSDRYKQSVEVCAELGATHMVVHSPLLFLGNPYSFTSPMIGFSSLNEVVHETLAEAVTLAESVKCTLVIENIWDAYPFMLTDLVKSFESDYVRQSLDTGHAFIRHTEVGAPPPDYWAREAGVLLAHIHLQDTDGYSDRHWRLGEGNIRWGVLFRVIAKLEQKPRLILEMRDYNDIARSAQWLVEQGLAQ